MLLRLLLSFLLARSTAGFHTGPGCDTNCQFPRRVKDEATFNSLNHHERSASIEEMNGKVKTTPRQFRAALLNLTSERRIIMIFEADGEARSSRLRKRSALRPRWPR